MMIIRAEQVIKMVESDRLHYSFIKYESIDKQNAKRIFIDKQRSSGVLL